MSPKLPREIKRKIDQLANVYEDQWQAGEAPDFEVLLGQIEESYREQLLLALVDVDFELRSKAGDQVDEQLYSPWGKIAVDRIGDLMTSHAAYDATIHQDDRGYLPTEKLNQIGRYKLLEKIGEGGMGSVWMAQQEQPVRRSVALKLIRGDLGSKEAIARFEAERQALAMMEHQNIAKVLDAGTTDDGGPYFVMELVQGIPLTKYCDDHRLPIRERLELLIPVCKAVQHAHQKGIIHRDLKPSNVLVTNIDGEAIPKVIDFGLAKALDQSAALTNKTMFTEFGKVVGTLRYMSPEQAGSGVLDIDTRSDIYSLGIMLYELLAGSTPVDKATVGRNALIQVLQLIREVEPPRPSDRLSSSETTISKISDQRRITPIRLQQILKGELDWVVMKALEKDRQRRYATAEGLAADINRFLNEEPVSAKPPSNLYRVRKFIQKHRSLVAASCAIVLLIIVGAITSAYLWTQAELARQDAVEQTKDALKSAQRTSSVLNIVTESFSSANPEMGATAEMKAKEVLFNAEQSLEQSDLDEEGRAELLLTLAKAFIGLGEYPEAIDAAHQAWASSKVVYGETDPATLSAMHHLSFAHFRNGEFDKSLTLDEKTVALRKKRLGHDHPDTLTSMTSLANSYFRNRKFEAALKLNQHVLRTRKRVLGSNHLDTVSSMNNLAICLKQAQQYDRAKELEIEALRLRRQKQGMDHTDTLTAMQQLASTHLALSDFDQAVSLGSQVFQLRQGRLGLEHSLTLRSQANLAIYLFHNGQTDAAMDHIGQIVKKYKQSDRPMNQDVIVFKRMIGRLIKKAKQNQNSQAAEKLKSLLNQL